MVGSLMPGASRRHLARLWWGLLYWLLMVCYFPILLLSILGWMLGTWVEEARDTLHEKAFGASR